MSGAFLQWVFGGLVVLVYAVTRFESPTPARATTTFGRYWVAKSCYVFTMLLLFTFLGGGLAQMPEIIALITSDVSLAGTAEKLPGPLFSALLLTTLLPHVPVLSKVDELVHAQFRRLGNIPFEVVQLSARLQQDGFRPAERFRQLIQDELSEIDAAVHSQGTPTSIAWIEVVGLFAILQKLPADRRYANYSHQKKPWFDQLMARYQTLKRLLIDQPYLLAENTEDEQRAVRNWRAQFRDELKDLRSGVYDLLAGGILQCERGSSARSNRLRELGFTQIEDVRNPLSFHEVVAVSGLIFLAMNGTVLLSRTFVMSADLDHVLMIAAMVSIIYAVALCVAIYPKGLWRFFDIAARGRRPFGAYFISAILGAVFALFISLTFKFLFAFPGDFIQALQDTRYRWPWLVMTAGVTFAIAWAADDYYMEGRHAPRWLRPAEAFGMAFAFAALQWWTQLLLEDAAQNAAAEQVRAQWRLISAGTIGFFVGLLVPHMYRNARSAAKQDVTSPVSTVAAPKSGVAPAITGLRKRERAQVGSFPATP